MVHKEISCGSYVQDLLGIVKEGENNLLVSHVASGVINHGMVP